MLTLRELTEKVINHRWTGTIGVSNRTERMDTVGLSAVVKAHQDCYVSHGLALGDKVLIETQPSVNTVGALLAAWHLGLVVVPVNAPMVQGVAEAIAHDCWASGFYTPDTGVFTPCVWPNRPESPFVFNSPRRLTGVDLALIIYTSGSTGKPKGILLTHQNVLVALEAITRYLGIEENDHILNVSPLAFDYGLYQLLFALYTNCDLTLYAGMLNPVGLMRALRHHQITILPLVPLIGSHLISGLSLSEGGLPALRKVTNTGGHLPDGTIKTLLEHLPDIDIFPMYGLTESKRALFLPPDQVARKKGSVGIPMPGLDAKLFREERQSGSRRFIEVLPGEVGTLFVRGASVMQGYQNDSDAGCEIVPGTYREDNWLSTGDLFRQDEEGFFYFVGREKELIKQAGFCLYPSEIEAVLCQNPKVEFAVVVGTVDNHGNEIAKLFVKHDYESDLDLMKWMKQQLGSAYVPKEMQVIDSLPFTHNGKVDKRRLLQIEEQSGSEEFA